MKSLLWSRSKHRSCAPHGASLESSENARYFQEIMREFGFQSQAALLLAGSQQTIGLSYGELRRRAEHCDVLFNVSGMLQEAALLEKIRLRVYLDLDPAFIQLWESVCKIDMHFSNHTHFVTVAQAMDLPDCTAPFCGRECHTSLLRYIAASNGRAQNHLQ